MRLRTVVCFTLASVFFGGTFVAAKGGQAYIPPLLFVAIRFDIAAILLLGYAYFTTAREDFLPCTRGDVAGILATGVFAIGLSNALLFVGQGQVTSAVGAIVFSLVPIASTILAAVLLSDERLSLTGAVGTVVGLVGVALVIGITPSTVRTGFGSGTLLVLAGALSLAFGTVLTRRATSRLSSTVRTAWALPVSALIAHAMSVGTGESIASVEWTVTAIVAIVYVGVFAGAIAYVAYFGLLDTIGAMHSSLTFYVSPVVATLGGWLLLGESISPLTVVGFAVIVVGFGIIGKASVLPLIHHVLPARSRPYWTDGPRGSPTRMVETNDTPQR